MMKKILSMVMATAMLLLCGCSNKDNAEAKAQIDSALEIVNGENRLSCDYMLEISFDGGSVLYYANGNACWDRNEIRATTIFDQNYLGSSVKMENYFADGKMYSLENKNPIEVERDGEVMLSKFPYFKIPSADGKISVVENSSGRAYKFVYSDTKQLCQNILGGDIYAFATVIKQPQPEKTQYGEAQCVYTLKDGKLVSARYEFDVKLFDTPGGSANYTPPESEYTLDLHVVAKLEYKGFGDSLEIAEYKPDKKEVDKPE